jgi:hypothetical protein
MKEVEEFQKQKRKKDRTVRNELTRATDKAKKEYLDSISDKITGFK